ncbi:PREDICTED: estrogen-related receptor gamma-like, partial [Priapulus caudatus]|uniref:Estrogen-related receptor gamma-like n=1 Tax=Priapulus caudatus TaxID=37621 RepID=A0ABM1F6G1_PRICU
VFRAINSEDMYPVMLKFLGKFGNRPMSREEFVALKALVLFNCDADLQAPEALLKLRGHAIAALQYVCRKQAPADALRASTVLLALPVLRHIDVMAKQYWFNVKKEAKLPLNRLFAEMLDNRDQFDPRDDDDDNDDIVDDDDDLMS